MLFAHVSVPRILSLVPSVVKICVAFITATAAVAAGRGVGGIFSRMPCAFGIFFLLLLLFLRLVILATLFTTFRLLLLSALFLLVAHVVR